MRAIRGKGIAIVGVLATVVALAGCGSPDPAAVQSAIASAPGIQGARVKVEHPGAPWNSQTGITIYVADSSTDAVTAAVRSALSELSKSALNGYPVMMDVVQGKPSDFSENNPEISAEVNLHDVTTNLGIKSTSPGTFLYLTSDEIRRVASQH
ncbi:hypothetical protein BJ986_002460 [Phycicoccus badiiscoriae]|uniref:Uncharacterized protein n=1 Tax=Pedococcus badiiscoriae TaxID=642776 RepID=A0A852WFG7_9MICO|nr:hypothetical protein [Pedococcus badiiscoriae]NYG07973.1 hypothetical protein [Pedococcus badiiscoriae]